MRKRSMRYPATIAMCASMLLVRASCVLADEELATSTTKRCEAMWEHLMSQISPRGSLHLIIEETQTPIPHPDHEDRVRKVLSEVHAGAEPLSASTSTVSPLSSEDLYAINLERYLRPKVYRREVGLSDAGYTLTTKEIVEEGVRPVVDYTVVARVAGDGKLTVMRIDHEAKRVFPQNPSSAPSYWWNLGTFSYNERGIAQSLVDVLDLIEKDQQGTSPLDPPVSRLCSAGALSVPTGSIRVTTETGDAGRLTRLDFDSVLTGPIVVLTDPENWAQVVSRREYSLRDPDRLMREEEFHYAATPDHDGPLAYPERVVRKLHGETHPGVRSIAEIKVTPSYAEAPEMMDFDDLKKKFPDYSFAE